MPEEVEGKLIGKVTHYFGNIGVAVVELQDTLKVFTQTVESMEVEHQKVETAKKGESIGLKVEQKVREGYKVFKL